MHERMVRERRAKVRRDETHIEVFLETLSIPEPASGRTIRVEPEWDSDTGKPSPYRFSFMGLDGYYHYFDVRDLPNFDVRDLPNWTEFSRPHPPYRDHKALKREWEAQKNIMNDLMGFSGLVIDLPFSTWLVTHRDPEWEEYFAARASHTKTKIAEAAHKGLLDLSL